MLRYYNYSKKFNESRLIYLTLDGKMPSEYSTGHEVFKLSTLSYKFEIVDWLIECKQLAVDLPLVREAISHYINLIKKLTNSSPVDDMNNEIVKLMMQSPESMLSAFELNKALINVKIETQWKFWEQLRVSFENKGIGPEEDIYRTVKHSKVKEYYEKPRNIECQYGLWIELDKKEGIYWGCVIQENIYFGFTILKDRHREITNVPEVSNYRNIILECDNLYDTHHANWLGWMYPSTKLNFREFNSQSVFNLVKMTTLENITSQIADKALDDINNFKKKLKNNLESTNYNQVEFAKHI